MKDTGISDAKTTVPWWKTIGRDIMGERRNGVTVNILGGVGLAVVVLYLIVLKLA